MNSAADIWERVLSLMKQTMTETTITTWFSDTEPVALDENRFILHVPTDFKREIVVSRYLGDIKKALFDLFSADLEVVVLTEQERAQYAKDEPAPKFLPGTEEYTFDRFVVGNSNKLAHAAAYAVAQHPAEKYNPLFIHGESGLGKTHLLYAIAHTIHKNHPDYKIIYIRGEDFTNELVGEIMKKKSAPAFREKYRSADVLLMDDVQFIAGRDATQEEMFHTFNALYENKKQIVFTADRPPKEMLRLEDRLKSRFEWGLLTDIQAPDYETRMAIIKNKAIRMGVELPDEVLMYVAENITSNVRQIEGTVKKILAYRDLLGSDVDASSVTRAVRDMFKETSDILPTAEVIIEEVGKFFDIDPETIRGQGRMKATSWARHIAIYLTREMTKLSLKEIGKEFDGRDHTTILHSIERVETKSKTDPETSEVIKDIRSNINERYN